MALGVMRNYTRAAQVHAVESLRLKSLLCFLTTHTLDYTVLSHLTLLAYTACVPSHAQKAAGGVGRDQPAEGQGTLEERLQALGNICLCLLS